jgi:hypothetical protein
VAHLPPHEVLGEPLVQAQHALVAQRAQVAQRRGALAHGRLERLGVLRALRGQLQPPPVLRGTGVKEMAGKWYDVLRKNVIYDTTAGGQA